MPSERILVVDDDASVLQTCARALTRRGYRLESADGALQALAWLRATSFDLLIADVKMPGMGGLELLENARQIDPQLATMVLTGYGTLATAVEAIKLGVRSFLLKPFTLEELTSAVERALDRTRLLAREQAARQQAEEAQRRLAFLAEASNAIASSLDYSTTAQRVAQLAIPTLADWCAVETVDEDGVPRLLAVAHVDPVKEALVRELRHRYPPVPQDSHGLPKVLRSGKPELCPDVQAAWRQSIARDAEHLRLMEMLAVRSLMCVPLRARGHTLGAVTFAADESGRTYGTSELALAEDLAHRCALALDNARLHGQLQETLRTREAFLASVAHDLKHPLTVIRGYAQLLKRHALEPRDEGAPRPVDWAGHVETHAIRMEDLLDEMLDIARLEADQPLPLRRRPVDLVDLARQAAATSEATSEQHTVQVMAEASEVVGYWDGRRLQRVLDNLLSNALKYSPPGGTVTLRVEREGHSAVLRLADKGVGIPEVDLPNVFERFHRGRNASQAGPGTGLGLWGARLIVERHEGSIDIESQEGEGTTVTVRLPL